MIGIDTNVLVRILADDDPVQTPKAAQFLHDRCSPDNPGFVSCVVVVELHWVLQSVYRYRRADIVRALRSLLENASLMIETREQVRAAMLQYDSSNCDFVDALINEINRFCGCEITVTFDRTAAKLPGFMAIS